MHQTIFLDFFELFKLHNEITLFIVKLLFFKNIIEVDLSFGKISNACN